jgi:hypothetical protein
MFTLYILKCLWEKQKNKVNKVHICQKKKTVAKESGEPEENTYLDPGAVYSCWKQTSDGFEQRCYCLNIFPKLFTGLKLIFLYSDNFFIYKKTSTKSVSCLPHSGI